MDQTGGSAPILDKLQSQRPGLFDLPVELRLRIYEYVVAPTGNVYFCAKGALRGLPSLIPIVKEQQQKYKYRFHAKLTLELLRTCRQIYREARDILFDCNTFFVCVNANMLSVLEPVNRQHLFRLDAPVVVRPMLRHVFLFTDLHDDQVTAEITHLLSSLTSLKTLRIAIVWSELRASSSRSLGRPVGGEGSYSCSHEKTLSMIIQTVPSDCNIDFGSRSETEAAYVRNASIASSLKTERRFEWKEVTVAQLKRDANTALKNRSARKTELQPLP